MKIDVHFSETSLHAISFLKYVTFQNWANELCPLNPKFTSWWLLNLALIKCPDKLVVVYFLGRLVRTLNTTRKNKLKSKMVQPLPYWEFFSLIG